MTLRKWFSRTLKPHPSLPDSFRVSLGGERDDKIDSVHLQHFKLQNRVSTGGSDGSEWGWLDLGEAERAERAGRVDPLVSQGSSETDPLDGLPVGDTLSFTPLPQWPPTLTYLGGRPASESTSESSETPPLTPATSSDSHSYTTGISNFSFPTRSFPTTPIHRRHSLPFYSSSPPPSSDGELTPTRALSPPPFRSRNSPSSPRLIPHSSPPLRMAAASFELAVRRVLTSPKHSPPSLDPSSTSPPIPVRRRRNSYGVGDEDESEEPLMTGMQFLEVTAWEEQGHLSPPSRRPTFFPPLLRQKSAPDCQRLFSGPIVGLFDIPELPDPVHAPSRASARLRAPSLRRQGGHLDLRQQAKRDEVMLRRKSLPARMGCSSELLHGMRNGWGVPETWAPGRGSLELVDEPARMKLWVRHSEFGFESSESYSPALIFKIANPDPIRLREGTSITV
ncbi:hypothetical protein P7C70_g7118, partial [Phenoliferia sp. Uapishka_3]